MTWRHGREPPLAPGAPSAEPGSAGRGLRYHPTMSSGARRSRVSAGIVLHRRTSGVLEVLLAHPGGPFFTRKDEGHWSIPKGEIEPGETQPGETEANPTTADAALLAVARREFAEETGSNAPDGPLIPLGSIVQKGGKVVHAWAIEGDLDATTSSSNEFEMEWPPGSGRMTSFPEIDRVAWFDGAEARRRVKPTQIPFLERLETHLGGAAGARTDSEADTLPR
jgi:predicted NUDIX family NTP pyrophosphohydrolase